MSPILPEDHAALRLAVETAASAADVYKAVDAVLKRRLDYSFLTLLHVSGQARDEIERVWSSDTDAYPIGGRKKLGFSPYWDLVIRGGNVFFARDDAALEWAFPDAYALIKRIGIACGINVPVRSFGVVRGVITVSYNRPRSEFWLVDAIAELSVYVAAAFAQHESGASARA